MTKLECSKRNKFISFYITKQNVPKVQFIFLTFLRKKISSARLQSIYLKVLTNEKRGGLSVVSFDSSPFKLFSLKIFKQIGAGPILWEA